MNPASLLSELARVQFRYIPPLAINQERKKIGVMEAANTLV